MRANTGSKDQAGGHHRGELPRFLTQSRTDHRAEAGLRLSKRQILGLDRLDDVLSDRFAIGHARGLDQSPFRIGRSGDHKDRSPGLGRLGVEVVQRLKPQIRRHGERVGAERGLRRQIALRVGL